MTELPLTVTPARAAYEAHQAAKAARLGMPFAAVWEGLNDGARADWEAGIAAGIARAAENGTLPAGTGSAGALLAELDRLSAERIMLRAVLREVLGRFRKRSWGRMWRASADGAVLHLYCEQAGIEDGR